MGYPKMDSILDDIQHSRGYFIIDGTRIAAYLCIDFDGEPSHANLNGKWKSTLPYAVIHRLAISNHFRGQGLSGVTLRLTEDLCRAKGFFSIHADTDEDNAIMRHVLEKYGYNYCGTVWFDNNIKFAYEKILDSCGGRYDFH